MAEDPSESVTVNPFRLHSIRCFTKQQSKGGLCGNKGGIRGGSSKTNRRQASLRGGRVRLRGNKLPYFCSRQKEILGPNGAK